MMIGLDSVTCERLCLTLLHSLWQFALLALAAWVIGRVLGRQRGNASYVTHAAALILGLIALPVTYAILSPDAATLPEASIELVDGEPNFTTVPSAFPDTIPAMTQSPAELPTAGEAFPLSSVPPSSVPLSSEVQPAEVANITLPPSHSTWRMMLPLLTVVYFIGVAIMLTRLVRSALILEKFRATAKPIVEGPVFEALAEICRQWSLKSAPILAHAEQVLVPRVVGLFKPMILLPSSALTGLSTDELELIIAHELAHVRRQDLWVNLLQRLVESILFFNPAMWWLSRRISTLREYCCDDLACAKADESPDLQIRYANALLHAVELHKKETTNSNAAQQVSSLAASGRSPSELRRRVARLFGEPLKEPRQLSRKYALVLTMMALVFTVAPFVLAGEQSVDKPTAGELRESESVEFFLVGQPALPPPYFSRSVGAQNVVGYYGVTDELTQNRIASMVHKMRSKRTVRPVLLEFREAETGKLWWTFDEHGKRNLNETPLLRSVLVDDAYQPIRGAETVVLKDNFAKQAAELVANTYRVNKPSFCDPQRILAIQTDFEQALERAIASNEIVLDQIPVARRASILTALRDNGAHHLCIENRSRNYYLEYPDHLKTLQWKILRALSRGEMTADQRSRHAMQRQWMRNVIDAFPEELPPDRTNAIRTNAMAKPDTMSEADLVADSMPDSDRGYRKLDEIVWRKDRAMGKAILEWRLNDPLMTPFDRPLTKSQFAQFQRIFGRDKNGREQWLANDRRRAQFPNLIGDRMYDQFFEVGLAKDWGLEGYSKSIPGFDDDEVVTAKLETHPGCKRGFVFELTFASNRRHVGHSDSVKDFFGGRPNNVLEISDGPKAQILFDLWSKGDSQLVLDELEEMGKGDVVLDAKRPELVGIRGAKLLRLDVDSWPAADAISNEDLLQRIRAHGSERIDLKEDYELRQQETFHEELERSRTGKGDVFFTVLNKEGKLAVVRTNNWNFPGEKSIRYENPFTSFRGFRIDSYWAVSRKRDLDQTPSRRRDQGRRGFK